jgi:type I restriction enzyme, S subunit
MVTQQIKTEYEQAELDMIPEGWIMKPLSGLCKKDGLVRGPFGSNLKKSFFVNSGIKIYEQKNAIKRNIVLGTYFITKKKFFELKRFEVKAGDFILSCSGTIGRIFLLPEKSPIGIINQALLLIKINEDIINKKYFFHYFDWDKLQEKIIDNTHGGAMKNLVGMSIFKQIPIALPKDPKEQLAIANALDDISEMIKKLEQSIIKKKNIKLGTMQELLTGKKRLEGFSEEWCYKTFGELFDFLKTGSNSRDELSRSGDFGYIHYGDIHAKWNQFLDCDNEEIPSISKEKVKTLPFLQDWDLIIADASEDYAGIGACILLKNIKNRKIVSGLHTMLLRSDKTKISPYYSAYLMSIRDVKDKLIKITTGISVYGLSKNQLKKVEVYLPKDINEQLEIGKILSNMDSEIKELESQKEKYVMIKHGMMRKLLTGEIRLK